MLIFLGTWDHFKTEVLSEQRVQTTIYHLTSLQLSIGPLLPLSDCTSEAVGSIPRLAPPPTGPLEQPLMPSSLISFEAHNESPAEDLETTSNGNAPTSSASAAKAPTVMSQLIDLHHSAFPNPFDENNKTVCSLRYLINFTKRITRITWLI